MLEKDWTFWLMMTNYALALITVIALALVIVSVGWELLIRKTQKAPDLKRRDWDSIAADWRAMLRADPHGLHIPGLGYTMADGGEERKPESSEKESGKE
jgi:hypothetical protein